jgi:hypothetical protein
MNILQFIIRQKQEDNMSKNMKKYFSIFIIALLILPTIMLTAFGEEPNAVIQGVLDSIIINDGKMIDASITLPTSGQNDSVIQWNIPTNNYLYSDGKLKSQPKYSEGPKDVTLTATVTYAGTSASRDYLVKIRPTTNIVRNPGFEDGMTNWSDVNAPVAGQTATIIDNVDIAHSGNKTCLVPLRQNNNSRLRYGFLAGELIANKKYYVSIWAKQKEPADTTAYVLSFYPPNTNSVTTDAQNSLTLTNEWKKLSIIVTTNKVGSDGKALALTGELFQLMNWAINPMTYYLDDYVVETALPYDVVVHGANKVSVPVMDSISENYTFNVLNQFGNTDDLTGEQVTWSLPNNNNGVSIDQTGKLTVTSSANYGDIVTIRAASSTYNWVYKDYDVLLEKLPDMAPEAKNISVTHTTKLSDKSAILSGEVITGMYEYFDLNYDEEGNSIYKWIALDSLNATTETILESGHIKGGQEASYTVKNTDINKYIKFVVTPYAVATPQIGSPVSSNGVLVTTVPAPVVLQTVPANNATNVLPSKDISINFNNHMNESTLTSSNISIVNTKTNSPVLWAGASYSDVDNKLVITPQNPLDLLTTYRVNVNGVVDFFGNTMPNYSFSFVTSDEDLTDVEVLQSVLNSIVVTNKNMIDSSLTLPTSGKYGTEILWSVPTNNYITSTGILKDQPKYAEGPKEVTLTATAKFSGVESSKNFVVKIKPTPNVVKNSGFEDGLTNWGMSGAKDGASPTIVDIAHSGTKSCLVPLRDNSNARMNYNFLAGDLQANKKYYVSVWAKQKEPAASTSYQLYYQVAATVVKDARINLTNDWQKLSIIVTTNAVDANNNPKPIAGSGVFLLMNEGNSPMTYYMDDFVVQLAVPYDIEVLGANEMSIPDKTLIFSEQYTSNILNQFGNTDEMTGQSVTWSLPDNNTGVTIDATGKISVNKNAVAGDIVRVRATNNTYTWLYTDHNVKLVKLAETAPIAQKFVNTITTTLADKTASLIGDVIKSKYEYFDINEDEETGSTYHWIGADSKDALTGTILESGNIKAGQEVSYTVKATDINKYIKLVVIPQSDADPKIGSPASTDGIIVRTVPEARNLQITGTASAGNELIGKYDYYHPNGYLQDGSIVGWYQGDTLLSTGTVYRVRGDEGTISFKVTPRAGIEPFDGLQQSASVTIKADAGTTVISNKGGGGGSYTPPAIKPTPTPDINTGFKDIGAHWAKAEIDQAVAMKLVNGKDDETFAPDDNITRAEFIALIARSSKPSEKEYTTTFSDVNKDDWFSGYVQTALDNEMISSDNNFRPNDLITREEMTKIIINSYLKSSGKQLQDGEQKRFIDNTDIAEWAVAYVNEANALGLVKGDSEGKFAPKDHATRAQSTVVILRLIKILNGGV